MATATVLRPIAPLRGSVTVLRPRKPDRRTEAEELQMEVCAAGQEMVAAGRQVEYAILASRPDVALHVAARLQVIGAGYADPDGPGRAA